MQENKSSKKANKATLSVLSIRCFLTSFVKIALKQLYPRLLLNDFPKIANDSVGIVLSANFCISYFFDISTSPSSCLIIFVSSWGCRDVCQFH